MKTLLVLATLFFAANALDKDFIDKFVAEVKKVGETCIKEVSASEDDIKVLLSHNIPESHEGKCLIFCFHKNFHIQNEDGSIDKDGAAKALEPLKEQDEDVYNKMVTVFKNCEGTPVESDSCDYAASLATCAAKEGKALGLDQLLAEIEI
ncbi:hypothetical protein Zmor_027408 [Zophobas morio]|uniref:Uncharacterized protein n=1 Tax=Zophobas morio TaxID=2755281 RepID=A0AA38HTJ9_9CUCU|nr:hypothetical protein Zmor_027408 [Zophobas morio]